MPECRRGWSTYKILVTCRYSIYEKIIFLLENKIINKVYIKVTIHEKFTVDCEEKKFNYLVV